MAANKSYEALQIDSLNGKETDQEKLHAENSEQQQDYDEGKEDKRSDDEMQSDEVQPAQSYMSEGPQSGAQLIKAKFETLGVKSSGSDQSPGLPLSSTTIESTGEAQLKDQIGALEKEPMAIVGVEVAQAQTKSQVQLSVSPATLSEVSPPSVIQPLSSARSPVIPDHSMLTPTGSSFHMLKSDQKTHSNGKNVTPILVRKSSTSDGYNWRKYGQKQVKSPTGSRSYYRCTHSDCSAKKIECCNNLGHIVEIVYRSHHSHDPPKKVNSSKESKLTQCSLSLVENSVIDPIRMLDDIDSSTSSKEPVQLTPSASEVKQQSSCSPMDNGEAKVREEHVNKLEPRKRLKKEEFTYSDSHMKPGKKPKFVVHAMGNVSISGDGYRWRKYGQKMVKGNPNPRNYYRCTSAGCPVRKHIETAVDNTSAVVITYKGVHDHDMPVPKKRHGPPSAPLIAATTPTASVNSLQPKKVETSHNQISSTQRPVDKGELTSQAMDLGGEKAMESARTLLSIGFEIKPC